MDSNVTSWDQPALAYVASHRPPALDTIVGALTMVGDAAVLVPVTVAAGIALGWRHRRWALAVLPVSALVVSSVSVALMKTALQRPRPPRVLALVGEQGWAFPSGHTTSATAVAFLFAVLLSAGQSRRRSVLIWILASGVAVTVGASRVYLGVHWPTDVLAGWLLGVLCATGTLLVWHFPAAAHRPHRTGATDP